MGRRPCQGGKGVIEMAATLLGRFTVKKYEGSRFSAVYDGDELVCVTVYKKGAKEVERRLIGYELALLSLSRELEGERG